LAVAETSRRSTVRELALPVPPLEEQHAIVRRVDQLLAASDALLARIDVAQRQVDLSSQPSSPRLSEVNWSRRVRLTSEVS